MPAEPVSPVMQPPRRKLSKSVEDVDVVVSSTNTKSKTTTTALEQSPSDPAAGAAADASTVEADVHRGSRRTQNLEGSTRQWSDEELNALRQAHADVNPRASNFWERVSRKVGSWTSTECCDQWFSSFERPVRNSSKLRKDGEVNFLLLGNATSAGGSSNGPVEEITKNRGTAKFRRQVRDAWARLEHGHADDLYESTPLKQVRSNDMLGY
jgi:hypothetical protein